MSCFDAKHLFYKYDPTIGKKFDVKILSSVKREKIDKFVLNNLQWKTKENLQSSVATPPKLGSFYENLGYTYDKHVLVPCGRCKACILNRSCEWAMRCMHEASMYEDNSFITLTYDNNHIPDRGTLVKRDVQLFWKKLRYYTNRQDKTHKIRYYYSGEYGDRTQRPHYHALVFNLDFGDKYLWRTERGHKYYRSPMLEKIWGKGMCIIGEVTFESAAYVARYCSKKAFGKEAEEKYTRVDMQTGEVYQVQREFSQSSTRGGIGAAWFSKYWKTDLFPRDECLVNGFVKKPPRYYLKLLEKTDKSVYLTVVQNRQQFLEDNKDKMLFVNLLAKERKIEQRYNQLLRGLVAEA